jgi:hypothetical protein
MIRNYSNVTTTATNIPTATNAVFVMDPASDSDDDGLSPGPADKDLVVIVYVHGQVRLGGSLVQVLQTC